MLGKTVWQLLFLLLLFLQNPSVYRSVGQNYYKNGTWCYSNYDGLLPRRHTHSLSFSPVTDSQHSGNKDSKKCRTGLLSYGELTPRCCGVWRRLMTESFRWGLTKRIRLSSSILVHPFPLTTHEYDLLYAHECIFLSVYLDYCWLCCC